jgi:hypothetical protein
MVTLRPVDCRGGKPHTIPVTLTFDPGKPFEVAFTFPRRTCGDQWVISRDLLIDGLNAPAGIGDVRIFPLGCLAVGILLDNGQDSACLKMDRDILTRFLADTASADDFLSDLEQWLTETPS